MNDHAPATPARHVVDRVTDLEVTVKWLTDEMGLLSQRLNQATQVEEIIRRARQNSSQPLTGGPDREHRGGLVRH